MRSAALWLLILVTATGFAIAGRQGVAYARATRGDYGLAQESQVRPAIPVFESLRALDGSSVPRDRDAIILLYNTGCNACNYNMANWMSLILAANQEYPKTMVAAVSVEPTESQQTYWSLLSDEGVHLFTSPNVAALTTSLGTKNVPSTIVIHRGKIVGNFLGILGPVRQARALRLLQ
jgi:hypothetical protein